MRDSLHSLLVVIFEISLSLFMLMGFIYIIGQLCGIFTHNGQLVLWCKNVLKDNANYVSCITGFSGFAAYYLKPKKA